MSVFIDEHRERFGVEPICQTLDVSASAYYQRATGMRSEREVEDERLLSVIRKTHKDNFEAYGYRKMWKALIRAGESAPRCQVQRLMASAGIQGAKRRGKPWRTTKADPTAVRAKDLVGRDFTAQAPNRLWVGDFTHLRCWEGKAYFSFVIDVYSRMIVGWQLAGHMRTSLVLDALRMALGLRQPGANFVLVAHTDAGSQYTSEDYTQQLDDAKVLASIGTVGDAYDNAMAESFVDSYKTELISDRVWRSRAQLELASVDYVAWFNERRLHESLGDVPPVEFEALHADPIASDPSISEDGSVQVAARKPADGLRTRRLTSVGVDFGPGAPILSENGAGAQADNGAVDEALLAQAAPTGAVR
ncbi:MAG: IS3 family transposase [Solirubrobacteraceae bacterium]